VKRIPYDKLVRDRIPEIIGAEGKDCTVELLSDRDYLRFLDEKLNEELAEYQDVATGSYCPRADGTRCPCKSSFRNGVTHHCFLRLTTCYPPCDGLSRSP
jgi:hypothetical protein